MEIEFANTEVFGNYVRELLQVIGEDPKREGLRETPERVYRALGELLRGYEEDPGKYLSKTFSSEGYDGMVILKNIEFYSFCEHHILPFFGSVSIGYVPDKRIVGVSKLVRVVEVFARRLQVQERLTKQIADSIDAYLSPRGVIVVCKARHLCMVSRGVNKQHSEMITSAIRGVFVGHEARSEFLRLIGMVG